MGSERNKREEGDGEKQGGAQDLSSHMELSGGTEPGRKMEAALPPSPPPPSTTPPLYHHHGGSLALSTSPRAARIFLWPHPDTDYEQAMDVCFCVSHIHLHTFYIFIYKRLEQAIFSIFEAKTLQLLSLTMP